MAAVSKVLAKVGMVVAAAGLIATGVGAVGGLGLVAAAGTAGAAVTTATLASIGTIASLASTALAVGAQITAKKPPPRGSVTQMILAAEPPRPYLMGESYFAGILRHQVGYGATYKGVPNPNLWMVNVYSGVGPVEALVEPQFDFEAIPAYYTGFYAIDSQLGERPEASALVPPYGTAPGWDSSSKLSGCAAIGWNFKFDREGKVYQGGLPAPGAIWRGEKVYDPRLDSTFPGGSGACRLGDEDTYVYSRNPALHAGTYAYGRFEGAQIIMGFGIAEEGIDWAAVAAWANDCDANEWYVDGVIFESGDGNDVEEKANNLNDICAAGGGRWIMAGSVLSFDWHRPRVALATMTDADLMPDGIDAIGVQSMRDRFNTVRPQYRSPEHKWELITAAPIAGSTYVTEDGETKAQTWPFNLVKGATQAGQLAAYALVDSREIGPISPTVGAEWRFWRPGDCIRIESELLDLYQDVVILQRELDPRALEVSFVLKSETYAKHAFALGKVADPPPTPIIGQTPEDRDEIGAAPLTFANWDGISGSAGQPTGNEVAGTINPGGGVADDQVVTTAAVAEAFTTKATAFSTTPVAFTSASAWYDLQTVVVTVSPEGESLDLTCETRWLVTDNCRVKERILRDGTPVSGSTTPDYALNTNDNPRGGFNISDDPGPGTYTYVYQGWCNDASNVSGSNNYLKAEGAKR